MINSDSVKGDETVMQPVQVTVTGDVVVDVWVEVTASGQRQTLFKKTVNVYLSNHYSQATL